jgi:GDP-6-deoxy-D-talose 4-dehydrogenase
LKILLTGALGFTGQHLTQAALKAGHEVVACDSDLCDPAALREDISTLDFTHVVHLAAISFVGHADDRAFYDVNLFGTLNLLDALTKASITPSKVLIASSANVYGNTPLSPIDETRMPEPVNHYATSKLAMEHMAKTFVDRLPIVMARPFNSTGPGQAASFVIPKLVRHYQDRAPAIELGNLTVEREFNDIRMVCEAYLRLLEKGVEKEIYNVCTGHPHTLQSVIDHLSEMTGHHPAIEVNPQFVRQNEVKRLCGDPTKLLHTVGLLPSYRLAETLGWMLSS